MGIEWEVAICLIRQIAISHSRLIVVQVLGQKIKLCYTLLENQGKGGIGLDKPWIFYGNRGGQSC